MKNVVNRFAYSFFLTALAIAPLRAADGNLLAQDVMKKVSEVYLHLNSLHIVVAREDRVTQNGNTASLLTACELAARGRQNYLARIKRNGEEAVSVSDGETTWKALPSKKQWTQIDAGVSGTEEDDAGPSNDLRTFVAITIFGQFAAIARLGQDPIIEKTEDIKVLGERFPCYVVRTHTEKAEYQLWIDRERFYVLQSVQKAAPKPGVTTEIRTRTTLMEVNQPIPDSLFKFEPGKGWAETEMLVLPGEERAMLTGARAANFTLKSLAGDSAALEQARGKVVVLDFWATWCPPCRAELPLIEKLRAEFSGKVEFYGVNDEEASTVKNFVKKNGYEMTVLMDGRRQVHHLYGVTAIPTLLVIDPQGVIRTHFVGGRNEAALRQAIQSALTPR